MEKDSRKFENGKKSITLLEEDKTTYIVAREAGREVYRTPKQLSLVWTPKEFKRVYNNVKTREELEKIIESIEVA